MFLSGCVAGNDGSNFYFIRVNGLTFAASDPHDVSTQCPPQQRRDHRREFVTARTVEYGRVPGAYFRGQHPLVRLLLHQKVILFCRLVSLLDVDQRRKREKWAANMQQSDIRAGGRSGKEGPPLYSSSVSCRERATRSQPPDLSCLPKAQLIIYNCLYTPNNNETSYINQNKMAEDFYTLSTQSTMNKSQ